MRIAFVVTHPIQYYSPLHRLLSKREGIDCKVFYTWHDGSEGVVDRGFGQSIKWDVPLTEGFAWEAVPNSSTNPSSSHFWGICNPTLLQSVTQWKPDVVHVTGYQFHSHLKLMYSLRRHGIPVCFRGDSHLLDTSTGWKTVAKKAILRTIFRLPTCFAYVGQANKAYYQSFGVSERRLFHCSHSIDTTRFIQNEKVDEQTAANWRSTLGIRPDKRVALFAGKFETKKQPVQFMDAVANLDPNRFAIVMLGSGELAEQVEQRAASKPELFRVLPFQNQSTMPVVYRLSDALVLPSAYGETWGLAVNEALACGRPSVVSDRVGCAVDVVLDRNCGAVFPTRDWDACRQAVTAILEGNWHLQRERLVKASRDFSIEATANSLINGLSSRVCLQ